MQHCCTFDAPNGLSLGFCLYLPPGYGEQDSFEWPLLVFLHSMHDRLDGDNNLVYESDSPLRLLSGDSRCPKALRERFVVLSPQCPGDRTRGDGTGIWLRKGWFESSTYDVKLEAAVAALIQASLAALRLNRRRVVVVGSSMGAYAALELSSKWPNAFAACGLVSAHYGPDPTDTLIERLVAAPLPLWFVHACNDQLCPFAPVETLVEELRARSLAEVKLTSFKDTWSKWGHCADRVAYWNAPPDGESGPAIGAELFEWLVEQQGPGIWPAVV